MPSRPVLLASLPLLLVGCFGSSSASSTVETKPGSRPATIAASKGACPLTLPNGKAPRDNSSGMNHGEGKLWTALWPYDLVIASPDNVTTDGAIEMKWAWFRGVGGQLRITGHRLDGKAPALWAGVPAGYGARGFQPSAIHFPTAGCWEVTGAVGKETLTFVTLVVKASAYAAFAG